MALLGGGAVCIWHDLAADAVDAFYDWHNREHMPERVAIPGFNRGRRYIAPAHSPMWFNLYETDSVAVLSGDDYLARLNAPTPLTRSVVPSFRDVARSLCNVVASIGDGDGGVMLTLRFDVAPAAAGVMRSTLCDTVLPAVARETGVAGAHLCRADAAASAVETTEKKARGSATAVPAWVVLIEGSTALAVERAASHVTACLAAHGVSGAASTTYTLQHTTTRAARNAVLDVG